MNATHYDLDGLEVSSPVTGGSSIFYIHTTKLANDQCSKSISAFKSTTQATIKVDLSKDVQPSSPPLDGDYYVECTDKDGFVSQTEDMASNRGAWYLGHKLNSNCDRIYDKVRVLDSNLYWNSRNGRSF